MTPRSALPLAAVAAFSLQACRDQPAPTEFGGPNVPVARVTPSEGANRYVVLFAAARVPTDFPERVAQLGGSVEAVLDAIGVASVSGLTPAAAMALARQTGVQAVERDLPGSPPVAAEMAVDPATTDGHAMVISSHASPAEAALYSRQWNLRAIAADATWARGLLGSPEVSVAILDSGLDYLHPELQGRVDLSRSISLVPALDAQVAVLFPDRHPITDLHTHGTATAGLVVSNAHLLAAVTQRTTVFGVKVHDGVSGSPMSVLLAGIVHAADHGADVIHMSFQARFRKSENPGLMAAVTRAVEYANRKGAVLVTFAGNTPAIQNVVGGPGDYDHDGDGFGFCVATHVICVSATGPTAAAGVDGPWTDVDAIAPYSNFGRSAIDVAAPGGAPLQRLGPAGGVWVLCALTTQIVAPPPSLQCRRGDNLLVSPSAGTSWSAGTTSGLAALLVAQLGKGKPALIRARILQSADDLGKPGTDPFYGKGRINVGRALGALP